ncbi:unnamed protein product, partial [Vitis vinifera]
MESRVCFCCSIGCGWQKIGAFINVAAYYLVGLLSTIILNFVLSIGGKVCKSFIFLASIYISIFVLLMLIFSCMGFGWESPVGAVYKHCCF